MKSILTAMLVLVAGALFAQEKTDSIKVWGNCGMCKSRIEKAAKAEGATAAVWNKDSKMLTVTYDASKTSNEAIQKKVASVGHDTEKFQAEDKVYEKLPGCCLYDRKGATPKNDHGDHKHK
jgi:periplasmic mercuric ion binding protein